MLDTDTPQAGLETDAQQAEAAMVEEAPPAMEPGDAEFFDSLADIDAPPTPEPEKADETDKASASEEAGDAVSEDERPAGEAKEGGDEKPGDEGKAEKPEPDPEEGPELTPEQRSAKRGFWGHYRDPAIPITDTISKMKTMDQARFDAMASEIVLERLAEPAAVFKTLAERSPEAYAKVVLEAFAGDPEFWREHLIKHNPDIAQALAAPAKPAPGADEWKLSEDTEEELRQWLPDEADKIIERLKAQPKAEDAKAVEAKAPEAKAEVKVEEPKTEQSAGPDPAVVQEVWDASYSVLERHFNAVADDPKTLALKVTDEERTGAPDVADLKDEKRFALFAPADYKGLPSFEDGLAKFGQGKVIDGKGNVVDGGDKAIDGVRFDDALRTWGDLIRKGDKAGAAEAVRALIPFGNAYLAERLKHPVIQRIDARLAAAARKASAAPRTETITPGSQTKTKSQNVSADPETALIEMAAEL